MSFPMPDPPMALHGEWSDWRDAALSWIGRQESSWTADDLRAALWESNLHWAGAAIKRASIRDLIELTGRVVKSSVKSPKGSLLPVWRTKLSIIYSACLFRLVCSSW